MSRRKAAHSYRQIPWDIARELLRGPKTSAELVELCGCDRVAVFNHLNTAISAGVICAKKSARRYTPRIFALCEKPFEIPQSLIDACSIKE